MRRRWGGESRQEQGRAPGRKARGPAYRAARRPKLSRPAPPARRRGGADPYRQAAQQRLRRYRQGSLLAVAFTGLFLLLWGAGGDAQALTQDAPPVAETVQPPAADDTVRPDPGRAVDEAAGTVRSLARDGLELLPKIGIALLILAVAAVLVRLVRSVLRRVLRLWERADAATAMAGVVIWLVAIGVALSVVAGDARALVGSVGLLGLALSWALQAPIESFAGWLLNSFKGYYRVGDRIAVGDVFGDVYRIDFLNTTVWEAGGPEKPVQGAQPTGALITFPNSEVLRNNVVNYTRMFPYVWDEVTFGVDAESDLDYATRLIADVARRVVGPGMAGPVAAYRQLLEREGLGSEIADEPQVYLSLTESWADVTVRYLVNARERRKWSSRLLLALSAEVALEEHRGRVRPSYPVVVRINREEPA